MELIVQKSTELGAAAIAPVAMIRSVVRLEGKGRGEEDRAMAEDRPRGGEAVRPRERAGGQAAAKAQRDA